MLLSNRDLRDLIKKALITIEPFRPRCIQPAGYIARTRAEYTLEPQSAFRVELEETIGLPPYIAAIIHSYDKQYTRGIAILETMLQPGYKGRLSVIVQNASRRSISIKSGTKIASIGFILLSSSPQGLGRTSRTEVQRNG